MKLTTAEYRAYLQKKPAQKKRQKKSPASKLLEEALQQHRITVLTKHSGQTVLAEHRFHPDRKWRFDFYLPACRIAIECEGGVYTQGRHTRGTGYVKDMAKYNAAQAMGIQVLRFTPDQLLSNEAIRTIRECINKITV